MIKNSQSLSMAEAAEYIQKDETNETDIKGFVKKFVRLAPEKAKELKQKIVDLDLMKVREEHISKIIDLLPETQEDLNKIFIGVGLDEDETKKILDIVKEYK